MPPSRATPAPSLQAVIRLHRPGRAGVGVAERKIRQKRATAGARSVGRDLGAARRSQRDFTARGRAPRGSPQFVCRSLSFPDRRAKLHLGRIGGQPRECHQ
jgi:hypothetical protein